MPRETPIDRIARCFQAGNAAGALQVANELLSQSPNSLIGRVARAQAYMHLFRFVEAEVDIDAALRISPNDDKARILRANMDIRLGHVDRAIDLLQPIARGRGPDSLVAKFELLTALYQSGRHDRFREEVSADGAWTKDPRASLMQARALATRDAEAGIERLKALFHSDAHWTQRRQGAFDAVTLLDKAGRYREAFDLASAAHAATTGPLQSTEWTDRLQEQLRLLDRGPGFFKPRAEPVQGVAFVVAMPRSGTTLLEQMLDRHPAVSGIGEFDGLDYVYHTLAGGGAWPRVPGAVPDSQFRELQRYYLDGAAQIRRPGASWTFDKTLRTWRALPEVATVLPGAVFITVDRDPRDVATSLFLSHFNAHTYNWTQSFAAIRELIGLQQRVVPKAFEVLGLRHEAVIYENLVDDPARYAARCLKLMGLEMDERVLSPEKNEKGSSTLSFAQVRQPINRRSVARWKNYEWAFDSSWDELVAAHESRRQATAALP
jgi:tetratricopeptide (TPR) repeat protein